MFVSDKKRSYHNLSWADFATVQGMSSHGLTKGGPDQKVFFYDDDGNDYDDDDGAGLHIYNGD